MTAHSKSTPTSVGTTPKSSSDAVLQVVDLHLRFKTARGYVHAVNGVNLDAYKGETLAIVGESGSGKTVTAQTVMGIVDRPPGEITKGRILYRGQDLLRMSERERRKLQGRHFGMVFQDAMTALNPRFSVGYQISEMFRVHAGMRGKQSRERAIELLDRVQIPAARNRLDDYPYQLSGGMRQRVVIAMAIALKPTILIADEPTTALDVTIQAKIMRLLADLQADVGVTLILITHDLAVVSGVADRVAVMYAGRVVECGPLEQVYRHPAHPYTHALLKSVPDSAPKGEPLTVIPGTPPDLALLPPGCPYQPRCDFRREICKEDDPAYEFLSNDRGSACHYKEEVLRAN